MNNVILDRFPPGTKVYYNLGSVTRVAEVKKLQVVVNSKGVPERCYILDNGQTVSEQILKLL